MKPPSTMLTNQHTAEILPYYDGGHATEYLDDGEAIDLATSNLTIAEWRKTSRAWIVSKSPESKSPERNRTKQRSTVTSSSLLTATKQSSGHLIRT